MARKVNELGADVVVCPMQTMGTWGRKYGLVLDTARSDLLRAPGTARLPAGSGPHPVAALPQGVWPQRLLLNRADIVATISRTTEALMAKYRLTSRPVRIISNAPQPAQLLRPRSGGRQTLLYMGSFMPYKNGDHARRMAESATRCTCSAGSRRSAAPNSSP